MQKLLLALGLLGAVIQLRPSAQAPPPAVPELNKAPEAGAVLAAARTALGGEAKLAAVKALTAVGRTRQVRGDNLVPIEFEIDIELPDKYVRKDEVPAQESGSTTTGFNGDELIEAPNAGAPPGRPGGPPPPTADQLAAGRRLRLLTVKQDFARLMLGLVPGSFPSYPLTFTYVGQAEAPQGMADVLEAKPEARGPAGQAPFTLRWFVYRETHRPVMVTWQGPPPGAGRGSGVGPGRGPAPSAPAQPPENRIFFADYREVDGIMLPFRLRRAVGADTIEETTIDRYRINAKIDARKFEVRK